MSIHVIERQSDTLMLYFSPMGGKKELFRTFEQLNFSVIYFIDEEKSWFSKGGFSNHALFEESIRTMLAGIPHTRLLISGTSMGGYGALRLCHTLKPERFILFSPQIDLRIGKVRKYHRNIDFNVLGLDNIVDVLKRNPDFDTPIEVHIGESEGDVEAAGKSKWGDREHAELLAANIKSTKIITHKGIHDHNILPTAKVEGTLTSFFI